MHLNVDKEGFLRQLSDWSEETAKQLAHLETIVLTPDHWEIITLARNYYSEFNLVPVNRVLVNTVKKNLGIDKGNSIYLMGLFGGKPAKIVAKIAGLPKPNNCD